LYILFDAGSVEFFMFYEMSRRAQTKNERTG